MMTQNETMRKTGFNASPLLAKIKRLPPSIIYAIAIVVTRAFSFITIPLMAAYVDVAHYGQFDVAVSLVEAVTLIAGLGIAAQLIRFGSIEETDGGQQIVAKELLGVSLATFVVFALLVQLAAGTMAEQFELEMGLMALRMQLLAGTTAALVELPLMWTRMKDRAWVYFIFSVARTIVGVILMWWVLQAGYGIDGVMIANGIVMTLSSILLAGALWLETGVSLNWRRFIQVLHYGGPIVGATLCMFALGNANRLFMTGVVDDVVIGHFGLAFRFAIAAYLLYAPFELWWLPKRIAILKEPDGLQRSAEYWSLGYAILLLGAGAICLTAPIFIEVALDEAYQGAIFYLPLLIGSTTLLYVVMLSNVGVYARKTGYMVLMVDAVGAVIAVGGYTLLVPTYGALGAIGAMVTGNFVRLGLSLALGHSLAPIPYPWLQAVLGSVATVIVVALAPSAELWGLRFLYSVVAGFGLLAALYYIGMLRPIEAPVRNFLETKFNVRRS